MTTWQLTIDCADPNVLVPFWAEALGYVPSPAPEGHATWRDWYLSVGVPEEELEDAECCDRLEDPAGEGPSLWFQIVPEAKVVKNRLHFDVYVGPRADRRDPARRPLVEARVARLVEAGGSVLRVTDNEVYAVLMGDPEGNEFCVA